MEEKMITKDSRKLSFFGIVPPHILDAIAKNGTPEQRTAVQKTISLSEHHRSARSARSARIAQNITEISSTLTAGPAHKNRIIYNAANTYELPGSLARKEGEPATNNAAVDEAYGGLGSTFDLFWNIYNRNSINNAGLDLIATVHYEQNFDNAFWNGSQMVLGDGDGKYFNRFTIAIDVIGHELTHGVTGNTAKLAYIGQSGALNESISDVFGSLVKQYALKQTAAQADWLIGAGLLAANISGVALRSMKVQGTAYNDPILGKDPQPAHMKDYVNMSYEYDNGGVHINSGIPNRAFYLTAIALGGNAWDKAGQIWYHTLTDLRLNTKANFQDFANLTTDTAKRLYGATERNTVVNAWQQVGITVAELRPPENLHFGP